MPDWVWVILLIILIWISRYSILLFFSNIWNLFGNNYCQSYPVYSKIEIGRIFNKMIGAYWLSNDSFKEYKQLLNKEGKTEKVKRLFKKWIEEESWGKRYEREKQIMIEANISVSNGKKNIEEIEKEHDALLNTLRQKEAKRIKEWYDEWENS